MPVSFCNVVAAFLLSPVLVGGQSHIPVTGLNTAIAATGERPARMNINYMQALGGPQWDLYILGLQAMQQLDQADPESYFQIAGIHGRPYIPWNGVESAPGRENVGYCFHNEIPFITWHRPYVALYEQILGRQVQDIALQYHGGNASSYRAAAASFRVPYWDWATDSNMPPAAAAPNMTVNTPDGKDTIPNPLHSFRWPNFPLDHGPAWFPTNNDPVFWNYTGTQRRINGDAGNGTLDITLGGLQDKVYAVLSKVADFDVMASTTGNGPSLEDPHNDIHMATGAFMESAIYSAFDPLFFLHHTNVDRLLALWQAINYNTTYQSRPANITWGTFAQEPGTQMSANDALAPFFQRDGKNMHTGRSMASTKSFGYTYPEIKDWSMSAERTRQAVIRQVNQLYGPDKVSRRRTRHDHREKEAEKQYYVQIGVERSELELPCTIQVMLGNDIVAGSMTIMAIPPTGRTNSEIQLNRGIKQLTSCVEDKVVVPLLEQELRIEIRKHNGVPVAIESISSLTVSVESVDVQLPKSDEELPKYGSRTVYPKIGTTSNGYSFSDHRDMGPGFLKRFVGLLLA